MSPSKTQSKPAPCWLSIREAVARIAGVGDAAVEAQMETIMAKDADCVDPTTIKELLARFNLKLTEVSEAGKRKIIDSYPKPHNTLKGITARHPDRFPAVWAEQPSPMLFEFEGRLAAFMDGKLLDDTKRQWKPVRRLYKVSKAS